MTALPEPITRRLLDEISNAYGTGGLSEFDLARLRREAYGLMKVAPADAHMVLGAIAAERYDIDVMRSHHKTSMELSPRNIEVRANYAVSLSRVGLIQEAIDILRELLATDPTNLLQLKHLLSEQIHGLRFVDAVKTKLTILQRQPDFDFRDLADVDALHMVLTRCGYSQDDAAKHMDLAFSILRARKVHFEEYVLLIDDDQDDSGVFVTLRVHAEIDQALAISDELFQVLDESIAAWRPEHLSISVDPFVALQ